jgi:hypothetical protein
MNAEIISQEVKAFLERRFGKSVQIGRGQVFSFGTSMTCSLNYSKLLGGHKYFYASPRDFLQPNKGFPPTKFGEFALLICGSADKVLVLPRLLVIEMMKAVPTRRVDVFLESGTYILQTTKHPKLNVTDYMNAFPKAESQTQTPDSSQDKSSPDRLHVKYQWSLIRLGHAEGCGVWVPVSDRNLAYRNQGFSSCTLSRLPNFGFEENSRRIVQNIDVLWLKKNVIRKAFEIESTTSVYSGLLRLNDLVLAQPNNNIDLYIVAASRRRVKVYDQLVRPSFQSLLSACRFVSFESIEDQMKHLETFPVESGARVTGLVSGEKFELPEHFVYPSNL